MHSRTTYWSVEEMLEQYLYSPPVGASNQVDYVKG